MNMVETKVLNNSTLYLELLKYKKEYFNLRFQKSLGELNGISRIKIVKKNIARILTTINSKIVKQKKINK